MAFRCTTSTRSYKVSRLNQSCLHPVFFALLLSSQFPTCLCILLWGWQLVLSTFFNWLPSSAWSLQFHLRATVKSPRLPFN